MVEPRTKLWYLKSLDLFSRLSKEEYQLLDKHSHMRDVKRGETLYIEGGLNSQLYVLKKGAVKITKLLPNGNEIILDIVSMGTVFGKLLGTSVEERDESAVVLEDGLICTFGKEDFESIIMKVPGLSVRMASMIEKKHQKVENKLVDLLYRTVEQRIAKTLLSLLDDFGVPHEDGLRLELKLTHKDIADLVASTRETVTVTLNKLKTDGLIDFQGKNIVITSLDKLRDLDAT
jgi:CRP-like cAMP-binding protein